MAENLSKTNVTNSKPNVGGSVFYAPEGTALPTDAKTALPEVFQSCGYISEDGVNNNLGRGDVVKAWGGDLVMMKDGSAEISLTFIETLRDSVLKIVHGSSNVKGDLDKGLTVEIGEDEAENYVFVIDMILRGNILKRVVIPRACVTSIGEITYSDDDATGYEVTLTCSKDANNKREYVHLIKKGGQ